MRLDQLEKMRRTPPPRKGKSPISNPSAKKLKIDTSGSGDQKPAAKRVTPTNNDDDDDVGHAPSKSDICDAPSPSKSSTDKQNESAAKSSTTKVVDSESELAVDLKGGGEDDWKSHSRSRGCEKGYKIDFVHG